MLISKINEDLRPLVSSQEDQGCWAIKALVYWSFAVFIFEEEAPCVSPMLPSIGMQDFIHERLLFQNS